MGFQVAIGEMQDDIAVRNINEFIGRRLPGTHWLRRGEALFFQALASPRLRGEFFEIWVHRIAR